MIRQVETDIAATITYQPTQGVPTSATVEVKTPNNTAIVAATAATIDSVDATVASASQHATELTLSSITGTVTPGTIYWLESTGGRGDPVEVVEFSGTTATLREGLVRDFAGGTLKGITISYNLTTTHTADIYRNCQVFWRYSVGGVVMPAGRYLLDIVRWPFALPITEQALRKADPSFETTGSDYNDLRELVEEEIFRRVAGQGINPDLVYSRGSLELAAVYGVLAHRYIRDEELHAKYEALRAAQYSSFLESKVWYDSDDDAVQDASVIDGAGTTVSSSGVITSGTTERPGEDFMPIKRMRVG